MPKFYSVYHVCTKGIEEFEGTVLPPDGEGEPSYVRGEGRFGRFEQLGKESFLDRRQAELAASQILIRKLNSLRKQQAKITKMLADLDEQIRKGFEQT